MDARKAVARYVAHLRDQPGERTGRDDAFSDFLLAMAQTYIGIHEELAGIRRALEPTHEEHPPR